MTKRNSRSRRNGNGSKNGPSRTPTAVLCRTFRQTAQYKLNNNTGSGINQYAYLSEYMVPTPQNCVGFKEAQKTFEFWRMKKLRVKALVGYNGYNATYSTINLDALAAIQIWTAADLSANETLSGQSVMSYNNARCNTLSLNKLTTIVNTQVRVNDFTTTPKVLLPATTWLDTSADCSTAKYSGFQLFAMMPSIVSTNWLPNIQLIFEYDVEFKQPAYQNRPTTFESEFVGSTLDVIPDASQPEERRLYEVKSYTLNDTGNNVRLERADGEPGSLDYTQYEFFTVYAVGKSGKYFGDRAAHYTGPIPRKPEGWERPE